MNPLWVVLFALAVGFVVWYLGRIPRVRSTAKRVAAPEHSRPETAVSLSGGVVQMPLSEAFQYLATIAASGSLVFNSGRRSGLVEFARGRIAAAQYRRFDGLDALLALLNESQGDFQFTKTGHPAEIPQGYEVFDVIMTWMESRSEGGDRDV